MMKQRRFPDQKIRNISAAKYEPWIIFPIFPQTDNNVVGKYDKGIGAANMRYVLAGAFRAD